MFETIVNNSPLLYFVQSLWRDEAFSILAAEQPLSVIIPKLSFEPPVYYTLLHFWIRIFGNSEIAARSLSFFAFAAACIVIIEWSDKLFRKSFLTWFVPLLFITNPMLLYYAFEVRTYGLYMLFTTLSMLAYSEKRRKLYVLSSVLGFYTHSYFVFVIGSQIVHHLITNPKIFRNARVFMRDATVRSFAVTSIFILPWIARIAVEASRLNKTWYFPVDMRLVKSVLGNMYIGYEGTPWFGWTYTAIGSLILLGMFAYTFLRAKNRKMIGYFLILIFLPLVTVIGISFFKPLFVNRYLIPVTISMVLLLGYFLAAIPKKSVRVIVAVILIGFNVLVNIRFPSYRAKKPVRTAVTEVNSIMKDKDLIYAADPLVYFETVYYAKDRSKVFLYNPSGGEFPWYVGDAIFSPERMVPTFPEYPSRAFMISRQGTFEIVYRLPELYPAPPEQVR